MDGGLERSEDLPPLGTAGGEAQVQGEGGPGASEA